jgi:hypothetical protein
MSQGNNLYTYLKQTKISFVSFFYKIREQEGGTGPSWGGWYRWRGKEVGKECARMNIVQILCTHICKLKGEKYSRNGGRER